MQQSTAANPAASNGNPGWTPDAESLEFLGDLADLAWFQVDRERNVVAMSQGMEALTGIRREEALGRPCIYLSRCHECLRHCGVFEEGRVKDHALTLYSSRGSEIPVAKSGQVLRGADGEIVGALEVVRPLGRGTAVDERCMDKGATESARIAQALNQTKYNRTEAARVLGMSRTTLWRKMREYDL
ncbi:MAG: PAS domain S-box protein [Gemmatimonadales bacterium]|jgi:PAS domain S-box-containing protein|nr:MAG: PAS domain S-box protein [Gemmatimonadales bacterium]